MKRLIDDLLNVARCDSGSLSVKRSIISVGATVAEFVRSQKHMLSSASLELRVHIPADLPDVFADHDRLLQMLENLVGNAVRFTPDGGRITIGARGQEGSVLFWVSDTGRGIDSAELGRLFAHSQPTRIGGHSTGLGLRIVKGIVEAHGGRLWAESTLGEGSSFFFSLPRTQSTPSRDDGGRTADDG